MIARCCSDYTCPQRDIVTTRDNCSFCDAETVPVGQVIPIAAHGSNVFREACDAIDLAMHQALGGA